MKMAWEQDSWQELKQVEPAHFTAALANEKATANRHAYEQKQLAAKETTGEDLVHSALAREHGQQQQQQYQQDHQVELEGTVHSLAINLRNTTSPGTNQQAQPRGPGRAERVVDRVAAKNAIARARHMKDKVDLAQSRVPRHAALGLPPRGSRQNGASGDKVVVSSKERALAASRRPRSAIVRWTPANSA